MTRRILAAVGVALLLVTAGCAGSFAPTTDASAQPQQQNQQAQNQQSQSQQAQNQQTQTQTQQAGEGGKTISVSSAGQAEAEPNQAVLRVAVLARGDDANAVREQLAENATQMREALRNASISDDQIRTVRYAIDQEYRRDDGEREPAGFRGIHAFEITISDVDRAGAVIDVAVSNGASQVDSVELTLSDERRREVRADALRNAMENARADADVVAESANLTVVGVRTASTGDVSFSPVRAEALSADAGGGGQTSIESGPVTVSAQVSVTYNATG
ncbi:SIMPL domain-containing protein [Halorussus ruber]|uniref:SIMPL domain-containing protein n=1 Tax=Halorussus ruber TaxID=1126238 RepID=UPI0010925362|nr:SIMPL domain-containing protein [Halorussus ruber]